MQTVTDHYRHVSTICECWSREARSDAAAEYYNRLAVVFAELVADLECPLYGLKVMELVA